MMKPEPVPCPPATLIMTTLGRTLAAMPATEAGAPVGEPRRDGAEAEPWLRSVPAVPGRYIPADQPAGQGRHQGEQQGVEGQPAAAQAVRPGWDGCAAPAEGRRAAAAARQAASSLPVSDGGSLPAGSGGSLPAGSGGSLPAGRWRPTGGRGAAATAAADSTGGPAACHDSADISCLPDQAPTAGNSPAFSHSSPRSGAIGLLSGMGWPCEASRRSPCAIRPQKPGPESCGSVSTT